MDVSIRGTTLLLGYDPRAARVGTVSHIAPLDPQPVLLTTKAPSPHEA